MKCLVLSVLLLSIGPSFSAVPPLRQGGGRGIRSYDLAMTRGGTGTYDFAVKASGALQTSAEPPPLFPKIEEIPVISSIYAMYQSMQKEKKHAEMRAVGKVDTSAFPVHGCSAKGRSALCSVPIDLNTGGFVYRANVTMALRLNPVNNTLTESLYVDGYQRWKGERPAASPGMCFYLKPDPEEPGVTQVIAIAPGPKEAELKRKLPMELAIRFEHIKSKTDLFAATLRAECKAKGATVALLPIGKVKVE